MMKTEFHYGKCGDKSQYLVDESENMMYIYGTGRIEEIEKKDELKEVKTIIIEEGIESIGDFVFSDFTQLETVRIPSTVSSIGINPFVECSSLTTVEFNLNNHFKKDNGMGSR